MATEIELERTFLVSSLPVQINGAPAEHIEDTYIPQNSNYPIVRLRQRNENFEITKKEQVNEGDASQHNEHSIALTKEEYQALQQASSRRLRKTRYLISVYGRQAQVDVYGGDLSGLVLVDFEFADQAAMQAFQKPEFCLVEVTQENTFRGGQLAGKTYANIQSELEQKGYQPIFYEEGQQAV